MNAIEAVDRPAAPKTLDDARALPTAKKSWFERRGLGPGVMDDSVIVFVDTDGQSKRVVWDDGCWAKEPFTL